MKGRVQKKHMEKFDDLSFDPLPHTNIVSVWNKNKTKNALWEKTRFTFVKALKML